MNDIMSALESLIGTVPADYKPLVFICSFIVILFVFNGLISLIASIFFGWRRS